MAKFLQLRQACALPLAERLAFFYVTSSSDGPLAEADELPDRLRELEEVRLYLTILITHLPSSHCIILLTC